MTKYMLHFFCFPKTVDEMRSVAEIIPNESNSDFGRTGIKRLQSSKRAVRQGMRFTSHNRKRMKSIIFMMLRRTVPAI